MKDFSLLIWLSQLGLSVAVPLALFVMLGVWLHEDLGWGSWAVWAGLVIGLCCAVTGFRDSLKAMERMAQDQKKDPPPASFNEHK